MYIYANNRHLNIHGFRINMRSYSVEVYSVEVYSDEVHSSQRALADDPQCQEVSNVSLICKPSQKGANRRWNSNGSVYLTNTKANNNILIYKYAYAPQTLWIKHATALPPSMYPGSQASGPPNPRISDSQLPGDQAPR